MLNTDAEAVLREGRAAALSQWLLDPVVALDPEDRRRAQLLAAALLALTVLGLAVGLVQLALIPGFRETFGVMSAAIAGLSVAYVGSRTRFFRISAAVACAAPAAACAIVAVVNPEDHVWYGFMLITVVFATVFFSAKVATALALVVFAMLWAIAAHVPELGAPERFVPILALHAVLSPLLLVAAWHQRGLERLRQRELRSKDIRLAEVRRMEVLGQLAGSVAHDFNNLVMVLADEINNMELELDVNGAEKFSQVRRITDKTTALSRQLLAIARQQPTEPKKLRLDVLIQTIAPLLSRLAGAQMKLSIHCAADLPLVTADPLQIEQALINLVINARDAMPKGGEITIETTSVFLGSEDVAAHAGAKPGEYILTVVSDSGVGMDETTRAKAFLPFFTTKSAGTGLGLTSVKGAAAELKGFVTVQSEPGIGTAFHLYLPGTRDGGQSVPAA